MNPVIPAILLIRVTSNRRVFPMVCQSRTETDGRGGARSGSKSRGHYAVLPPHSPLHCSRRVGVGQTMPKLSDYKGRGPAGSQPVSSEGQESAGAKDAQDVAVHNAISARRELMKAEQQRAAALGPPLFRHEDGTLQKTKPPQHPRTVAARQRWAQMRADALAAVLCQDPSSTLAALDIVHSSVAS